MAKVVPLANFSYPRRNLRLSAVQTVLRIRSKSSGKPKKRFARFVIDSIPLSSDEDGYSPLYADGAERKSSKAV